MKMILRKFGKPVETISGNLMDAVTLIKYKSNGTILRLLFLDKDYPNKKFPTKIRIEKLKFTILDGEFKKK